MSNHLRELIDQASGKGIRFLPGHVDKHVELVAIEIEHLHNAMCFEFGKQERFAGIEFNHDGWINLPYDHCWFETQMPDDSIVGISLRKNQRKELKEIVVSIFVKNVGEEWAYQLTFLCDDLLSEEISATGTFGKETRKYMASEFRLWCCAFICSINNKNYKKTEHKPDEKLQKARAKRGKKPLFSYWTLELTDPKTESGDARGGTHASPRLHLRRGHPRQFKPGHWTWVQPCAVGNKKLGMVHKDYSFTPSNDTVH